MALQHLLSATLTPEVYVSSRVGSTPWGRPGWTMPVCCAPVCTLLVSVAVRREMHRPVDFPAWCEMKVEPVTCKVFLVQTADPRLPCTPGETDQDPRHGSLQLQLDGGIRTETNNSLTYT
ncbi:hypothetical protein GOODEAATRI_002974 [Goodea atripinnis]|uniref:Uncharacterized protein n=1 Tax=Goodea atripinnis TaxID=208336 RepID=A0ABV0MEK0_9TELE